MDKEYKNLVLGCQNCKNDFTIESDDFSFYEKMKVPPPTFCPLCRAQRRLAWRNERKLFKVKNFLTGEIIFSSYPSESGRKIMTRASHKISLNFCLSGSSAANNFLSRIEYKIS